MQARKPNFHKLNYQSNSSDAYEGIELDTENLNFLESSKSNMKAFLATLTHISNTPILDWILKYVGKMKVDNLNDEAILNLVDRRVEKMKKNKKIKKNWGAQDAKILVWTVSKYCELNRIFRLDDMTVIDWEFISNNIPGSHSRDCLFKWLTLKKTKLSECQWSEEESESLRKLVETYGEEEWKQISLELYEMNQNKKKKFRNPKQCKERWLSFLNPDKRTGPWSKQEDKKLLQWVYEKKGEKKWSEIRKNFSGRTENAMKNRYNLLIEKQIKATNSKQVDELQLILLALKTMGVKTKSKEHVEEDPLSEPVEPLSENENELMESQNKSQFGISLDPAKKRYPAQNIRVIPSNILLLEKLAEEYVPAFYPAVYIDNTIHILNPEEIE